MSTWEERMAARAAVRRAEAEAAEAVRQAEEQARLIAEAGPPVPGEFDYVTEYGEHRGHRTHIDPWHGNSVTCSCGAFMGCFSIAIDGAEPEPEPCPVCAARGIGRQAQG